MSPSGKAPPSSRAATLRKQADAIEKLDRLQEPFLAAKAASQADPKNTAKRRAYDKLAEQLVTARQASRAVAVVDVDGGNATVVPNGGRPIGGGR